MSLKSDLKSDLKPGSKNVHHFPAKEKSPEQKHRDNLINRILNNYFGILVIVVVLAILIASYFFLILPKYQKIVATINATFYEKNQLAPKYRELSDYQALIEAYKNVTSTDVERVKNLIPKEYIKEDLFTEMIYLASAKGLTVNSLNVIKYGEATSTSPVGGATRVSGANVAAAPTSSPSLDLRLPSGIGAFVVKITLGKASYPALKTWIQTMENSLRIIDVKSLSFDPKTSVASLEMVTYYLKK